MTVLVTGGAGYIGSSLVEKLDELEAIQKIYVLDNLSRSPLAFFLGTKKFSKVTFVKGDILDSFVLDELLEKIDVVYHLAGYVLSPYNYAQNVQYEQINQWGTLNLVRSVQRSSNKIRKFVFLSSASVYGLRGKMDINNQPQPTNAYGKSKLAAEKYVMLLADYCQVSIIRAANVFGFNTSLRTDSVLNSFIFQALVSKKILIYGSGAQKRPFVSLDIVVETLLEKVTLSKGDNIVNLMQFNASLNEVKDWLVNSHIRDLEYTYINRNIEYEQQYFNNLNNIKDNIELLDKVFIKFKKNIRL